MKITNSKLREDIYASLRVGNYNGALSNINTLLNRGVADYEIAEFHNLKAKCLMNLGRYDDALYFFIISWLKNDLYVNHRIFDKVFSEVYGKKIKKAFWFFLYRDYEKNNNSQRASRYHRFILKNNRDINIDEVLLFVDNYNLKLDSDSPDTQLDNSNINNDRNNGFEDDFSKYMELANECIDKKDYEQAIFYLNKISTHKTAINKMRDLIILEAMNNYQNIDSNYEDSWRIIGNLNKVIPFNDEALLIKGFYLLNLGYFERSKECYDEYLKKHKKDKRAIFGKICVLNEMGQYDEALKYINSVPSKYREYLKSEIFMANGQTQNAIEILDSILKDTNDETDILFRKARAYYVDLKFKKVLIELDAILEIDATNIEALLFKGEILAGIHKYDSAIDTFDSISSEYLSQGHKKLAEYLKNLKGKNSGFYGVFEQDSFWEYVYVETNIFKRIKAQYIDELEFEILKRGLPWKGINRNLQKKTTSKNKLKHIVEEEFIYDLIQDDNYPDMLEINNSTIKRFDKYLKSNPNNFKALNNKGYVLLILEKTDDAIECFEKALDINVDDFHAWFNKGVAYLKYGRYYDAKKCFLKFLNLNEDIPTLFKENISNYFYDFGWSLYENEKYQDSIHCYDISIGFNPEVSNYLNCKAISLENLKMFDEALDFYSKALEIEPNDDVLKDNKLNCYRNKIVDLGKNEDFAGAIECCNNALNEFPNEPHFYNFYGISLAYLGRFDEALDFYSKALEIEPNDDVLKDNKLNCYYDNIVDLGKSEDFTSAIECCNNALNEFPNEPELYFYKVMYLNKLGKFDDAFIFCNDALKKFPEDPNLYGCKGICLEKLDKFDEAIEYYDEALKKFPEDPNLYGCKGICLEKLDKFDEAIECFDKGLEIEPDNEYILKNREKCFENKKNV